MIDVDIARRLRDLGLRWQPRDGDHFVIDVPELRERPFMLSSMVVERGLGRRGEALFKFNGTTEWALDTIEQHEAVWVPREDQLREALGESFLGLYQREDVFVVQLRGADGPREIRAPLAEDAYAGALYVLLEETRESGPA